MDICIYIYTENRDPSIKQRTEIHESPRIYLIRISAYISIYKTEKIDLHLSLFIKSEVIWIYAYIPIY